MNEKYVYYLLWDSKNNLTSLKLTTLEYISHTNDTWN